MSPVRFEIRNFHFYLKFTRYFLSITLNIAPKNSLIEANKIILLESRITFYL